MGNIIAAIERSAETGDAVVVEGDCHEDALDLIDGGLAEVSEGENGVAILTGSDPYDRPYTVTLVDHYAHEFAGA